MSRKIVIRGMGLISAPGDLDSFARALFTGQVSPGPSSRKPGLFAGEIPEFKARSYIQQKGLNVLSRSALLSTAALSVLRKSTAALFEPVEESGESAPERGSRIGLVVGTAFGHIESKTRYSEEAVQDGVALVSPILFPNTIINSLGGHGAIIQKWNGPNSTITSGNRSSLDAAGYALELLRRGRADRVALVGCDEVSRPLLDGLLERGTLSREDPRGPRASIPFHPGRGGIYPAEASAAFFLLPEEETSPPEAGAALGEIAATGAASSVRRGTAGAIREAMEMALDSAGLKPADVGWVALSGSGSVELDAAEAEAVAGVFGEGMPAAAIKRQCGETFGAGGALSLVAAVLSFHRGEIPPTPGAEGGLLSGLSSRPRPLQGPPAVLVSAVDEDGAAALIVKK